MTKSNDSSERFVRPCAQHGRGPCFVAPSPKVMGSLYAEYKSKALEGIRFQDYLKAIGYVDHSWCHQGMDDRIRIAAPDTSAELLSIPRKPVNGRVQVLALMVDFPDLPGELPKSHYETLLFSEKRLPTQSMREYYAEVSRNRVELTGSVHGWLRMPEPYAFYTNGNSGTSWSDYPRNAPRLAEDAVRAALEARVLFDAGLDVLKDQTVTALFIIHAGLGAERMHARLRGGHIWSHKWNLRNPIPVNGGISVVQYLMVPKDCDVGVCAHELGHLVFQWQDFYDPNYADDGDFWDGAGLWDLMAGGSYNKDGSRPAHPAVLHKTQHGWVGVDEVTQSKSIELLPITSTDGRAVRIRSPRLKRHQYLLLENRTQDGFDADLPGEGLLVWQVDEVKEMTGAADPGMALIQADGRKDLNDPNDVNKGDAGDPFPGIGDVGELPHVRFSDGQDAGIRLSNIRRDGRSIRVDVEVDTGARRVGTEEGNPNPTPQVPTIPEAPANAGQTLTLEGRVDGFLETAIVWVEGHDLGIFKTPPEDGLRGAGGGTVKLRPGLYTLALEARGRPETRWTVSLQGASEQVLELTIRSGGSGFSSTLLRVT
jgi:immune inhibitor A